MTEVDVSNPDLLRNIDPIRKAVYDEEGAAKFHIGHLHEPAPADLFGWADKERGGKKAPYEMADMTDGSTDQWELDVKTLISSTKWLNIHGLHRCRLTMKQILAAIGFKHSEDYVQTLGRPVGSYYGLGLFQQFKRKDGQLYNVTVGREKLKQIEEGLLRASHLFKRRMQWLTTGSRRIFGVVQEHCICFVLDVTTMSQTQFDLYREALCDVIKNQVSQLAKFNMIKAQADMQMWQEQAVPVTEVTIKSAIEWVNKLDRMAESSRTGCAEAILKAMEDDSLESVYLFAEGDSCELSKEILRQKLMEAPHVLHTVSFNATKTGTIKFLKEIADQTSGRFHAFVVKNIFEEDAEALPASAAPPGGDANRISNRYAQKAKGGIPPGAGVREDVFKIWSELEECRNNHAQVITLLSEIPDPKTDSATIQRPAITDGKRLEQYMSSKEWLSRHGLEARKLTAFHALAGCSFKHVDGVVDLKGKPGPNNVSSDAEKMRKLVNAKYCEQFAHTEWKDGTLVHVHITAEQHRMYEKRMGTTLDAIQKRIDWLQQGSREVFGTILEEQVYILIDTSLSMQDKLPMVKEKLFQLMQEQLRHKNKFNFVQFDTKAVAWKDRACDVTEQNLLNAWSWIKDIGVGGSTNTLAALRIALSDPHTHAIYLLTDGRPDQSPQMIWKFVQQPRAVLAQVQLQHPVPIHTIAFNCNDLEANQFLHQLSSDTGGRYHNFASNGSLPESPPPFESEDVSLLKRELEHGKRDLEKVSKLRARCVMLDWFHNKKNKSIMSPTTSPSSADVSTASSRRQHRSLSRPKRSSSALVRRRDDSCCSDNSYQRPHTSLGHYSNPSPPGTPPPSMEVAHKNHRGSRGSNDAVISAQRRSRKSRNPGRQAGHTRTSMLRLGGSGESHGWMLPETEEFYERQIDKSVEAYQDIMRLKSEKKKAPKKKRKPINVLDIPNTVWLKKNGLIAKKLTVMDVLTPTVVRVKPKYIPVLDKHVVSKVFNEVLPIAHVSPRNKREIRLVNPAAVDLRGYDQRLKTAIEQFHQRLDLQVWRKLSQEEREKFDNGPVSYINNSDAVHQAFDRLGWPIEAGELQLLVDEIHLGERYLQQSQDLQNTAKKVAMGGKKGDVSSSSSSEASEQTPQVYEPTESKGKSVTKHSRIDRLKGQKVIARDEIDGFYYSGIAIRSTDVRHALIRFKHGTEAIVPTRFVISRSGAVSCPPLQIGDQVFGFSRKDSNVSCYVPGIVIGIPAKSQVRDKFYTVLKYDNTKTNLLRNKMVKISQVRYSFAVRYIQRASQIDPTVPSVDFVPAQSPREPEYVDQMKASLQDLQILLDENCKEQQEQREILVQQSFELEDARKELKNMANNEEDKKRLLRDLQTRSSATNTGPMTNDISTNTDPVSPESTPSTPPTHTSSSTMTTVTPIPDKSEDDKGRTIIAVNEQKESVMITKDNEGVHVSRNPPEVISPAAALVRELSSKLPPGQELLARCTTDGWYYRGTVQAANPDDSYDILDCTGFIQQTYREDIITDADDANNVIKERDTLVALHPSFPNSYAPAVTLECKPNDWFLVRFYDKAEANVQREDVYLIHPSKFKQDVDFITNKEKQWIGRPVVARSDMDGQYHLASCVSRVGNGHQYILQWPDGSTSTQHLSCMFDAGYSSRRPVKVGDCVIALYDNTNLVYLPGRVMNQNGDELVVNFCNRARLNSVDLKQCFWISRQYHDLAVAFYNSKQLA